MARFVNPRPQVVDGNGDPIVGASLYFFEPGSSTLKTIYSDSALSLATTNPQLTDSDGRFDDIFLSGTYKVVLEDEDGVTIYTADPVGSTSTGQWEDWDSGTTYVIGDFVQGSDGEYYRSLTDNNIGNDPTTSPANWELLYLGRVWNTNVTYGLGDTVYGSDGYLYISRINSNLSNDPTTDRVNWWPGSPEHIAVTAAGTDTYTATYGETAYRTGWQYYITFTNANTAAAPTINLDSLGAKTIKKDGGIALDAGDIPAGHEAILRYDGTDMILLNPAIQLNVSTHQETDSTDITLAAPGAANTIGSSFSFDVPTKGLLYVDLNEGQIDAVTNTINPIIGIKISATEYFPQYDDNGTPNYSSPLGAAAAGTANIYSGNNSGSFPMSIEGLSVPTGTQTVSFIIAEADSDSGGTLKGTVTTTRISLVAQEVE